MRCSRPFSTTPALNQLRIIPLAGKRAEHGQDVVVRDPVKRPGQICVQNPPPFRASALDDVVDRLDRVMAATTGPESIGLRLKPGFPLGLQRVHDPGVSTTSPSTPAVKRVSILSDRATQALPAAG